MKIFKLLAYTFCRSIRWFPDFVHLSKIWVFFEPNFLRANKPPLSPAVWSWETNEPILETRNVELQHISKARKSKIFSWTPFCYTLKQRNKEKKKHRNKETKRNRGTEKQRNIEINKPRYKETEEHRNIETKVTEKQR